MAAGVFLVRNALAKTFNAKDNEDRSLKIRLFTFADFISAFCLIFIPILSKNISSHIYWYAVLFTFIFWTHLTRALEYIFGLANPYCRTFPQFIHTLLFILFPAVILFLIYIN